LNLSTVNHHSIASRLEIELGNQALHGLKYLEKDFLVSLRQILQTGKAALGHDQDVQRVGWLGMVKSQQIGGIAQALNRDEKIHFRKYQGRQTPPEM